MQNFFHYENKFMSAIGAIADGIVLGILWIICSIPIFTIGASSAAFYYAYNKCIFRKEGYVWGTFFSGFKTNFKQATLIWLILLGLSALFAVDFYLLRFMHNAALLVLIIRTVLIGLILGSLILTLYLFPYLSRFEISNRTAIKNCTLLALANLPQSILLLILFALCFIGFVCLPLLNLLIPALYMLCANRILEAVFRKYMSEEDLAAQIQEAVAETAVR